MGAGPSLLLAALLLLLSGDGAVR
nr:mutant cathepsin C [Homo sapiens]